MGETKRTGGGVEEAKKTSGVWAWTGLQLLAGLLNQEQRLKKL